MEHFVTLIFIFLKFQLISQVTCNVRNLSTKYELSTNFASWVMSTVISQQLQVKFSQTNRRKDTVKCIMRPP